MTERTANTLRNIGTIIVLAAAGAMLMGCKATMTQIKVPVPVACQETEPVRPIMPTDSLMPGASLDKAQAAQQAEIARREAYELQLVTALRACIAPIQPK